MKAYDVRGRDRASFVASGSQPGPRSEAPGGPWREFASLLLLFTGFLGTAYVLLWKPLLSNLGL